MSSALLKPEDRVLSTLNADGSRRWIKPRVVPGRFLTARRIVAYILIAIFTVLPFVRINNLPAILLDIQHRQFTLFGKTFLPTDTLLLALFMLCVFVTIFLLTAVFGRVWCGWGCPQTVYLEFVYRPIERLFEGAPGRTAPSTYKGLRKAGKLLVYLIISMALAHTFLAYFVGTDALRQWVQQSPIEHPLPFFVMVFVTGAMMFDFAFFREQACFVACPYGRFQSVMIDRDSMIVTYDSKRGEPRGKGKPVDLSLPVLTTAPAARGDCIDCNMCVAVCPTGIDIRKGLQMECIGCAQCIDACDSVMAKVKKPLGLIRYSSQNALAGSKHFIRPRVIIYPIILLVLCSLLVWRLNSAASADVSILRGRGLPFNTLENGEIANQLTIKIVNRSQGPAQYTLAIAPEHEKAGVKLVASENPIKLPKGELRSEPLLFTLPTSALNHGTRDIQLIVSDGQGFSQTLKVHLLGPKTSDHHDDKDQHKDEHHDQEHHE
jgi:cytochrome c oxidase accessory protein FixG